uniref:Uncharacterized protein n=1 Tax=Anguilla anguilla TaxID=7936 RepID=A0A0E9RUW2_ANGAN
MCLFASAFLVFVCFKLTDDVRGKTFSYTFWGQLALHNQTATIIQHYMNDL